MLQHPSIQSALSHETSKRGLIILILGKENLKSNPVYISKLTKLFNASIESDKEKLTNSSIRRNIKALRKNNIIQAINEGGRPEYLELTELGKQVFDSILLEGIEGQI